MECVLRWYPTRYRPVTKHTEGDERNRYNTKRVKSHASEYIIAVLIKYKTTGRCKESPMAGYAWGYSRWYSITYPSITYLLNRIYQCFEVEAGRRGGSIAQALE